MMNRAQRATFRAGVLQVLCPVPAWPDRRVTGLFLAVPVTVALLIAQGREWRSLRRDGARLLIRAWQSLFPPLPRPPRNGLRIPLSMALLLTGRTLRALFLLMAGMQALGMLLFFLSGVMVLLQALASGLAGGGSLWLRCS